jgi:hypothetical protein
MPVHTLSKPVKKTKFVAFVEGTLASCGVSRELGGLFRAISQFLISLCPGKSFLGKLAVFLGEPSVPTQSKPLSAGVIDGNTLNRFSCEIAICLRCGLGLRTQARFCHGGI